MDFGCRFRVTLPEPICAEIAHPNNKRGVANEVAQIDSLIRFGTEYVVGMAGKAVGDAEKAFEPPSSPGSQTGKMDVKVRDPFFLESWPQVRSLAEATFISKIPRAGPKIGESGGDKFGFDFEFQAVGVRKIINRNVVQGDVGGSSSRWSADRVHWGCGSLPIELSDFTGAKRLGKRGEALEEVAQLPIHFEGITDMTQVRKGYGSPSF